MHTVLVEDRNTQTIEHLGLDPKNIQEVVLKLIQAQADYQVFYQKLRHYHWNVTGNRFFRMHDEFERMYNQAKTNIDDIAERVRILGFQPLGTLQACLEVSDIKESESVPNPEEMMAHVHQDIATLIRNFRDLLGSADKAEDPGTDDLIVGMLRQLEQDHWMVKSWLS